MQLFLESQEAEVWKSVQNGLYIPNLLVTGVSQPKLEDTWRNYDNKKFFMIVKREIY